MDNFLESRATESSPNAYRSSGVKAKSFIHTNNAITNEAERLINQGFHLIRLHDLSKQPVGENWNSEQNRVTSIDPSATGYGLHLRSNGICSLDPDNELLAHIGFNALCDHYGLNTTLEDLLALGVRTSSTRPGSGGRSAFKSHPDLEWVKFSSKLTSTILELRANSENLQDCIAGTRYADKKTGEIYEQQYAGSKRLEEASELPDEMLEFWLKISTDPIEKRKAQNIFYEAVSEHLGTTLDGLGGHQDISGGGKLYFSEPGVTREFNENHNVEDYLSRHGYDFDGTRYSAPMATGAPGIRLIPGKDDLWQSDHASDPLFGTFDAWTCFVMLDHNGNKDGALKAYQAEKDKQTVELFTSLDDGLIEHEVSDYPRATKFVIEGLIAEGISVLASYPGGGKTSAMIALASHVTRAYKPNISHPELDVLKPRHVIYFTEHPEQVEMIISAMISEDYVNSKLIRERLHIVPAKRVAPTGLAELAEKVVLGSYLNPVERNGISIKATPWVVFDTTSAMIELDDENSNAQWSKAISALKHAYKGIPLTLVAHTSKSGKDATDASNLTTRGGSALEGDANQIMFLTVEDNRRYIDIEKPKHRFTPKASSIGVEGVQVGVKSLNEFNEEVSEIVTICRLSLVNAEDRAEIRKDAERRQMKITFEINQRKINDAVMREIDGMCLPSKTSFNDLIRDLQIPGFAKKQKAIELADFGIASGEYSLVCKGEPLLDKLKGKGYKITPQAREFVLPSGVLSQLEDNESRG